MKVERASQFIFSQFQFVIHRVKLLNLFVLVTLSLSSFLIKDVSVVENWLPFFTFCHRFYSFCFLAAYLSLYGSAWGPRTELSSARKVTAALPGSEAAGGREWAVNLSTAALRGYIIHPDLGLRFFWWNQTSRSLPQAASEASKGSGAKSGLCAHSWPGENFTPAGLLIAMNKEIPVDPICYVAGSLDLQSCVVFCYTMSTPFWFEVKMVFFSVLIPIMLYMFVALRIPNCFFFKVSKIFWLRWATSNRMEHYEPRHQIIID